MILITIVKCKNNDCKNIIPSNIVLLFRGPLDPKRECEPCRVGKNPIQKQCLNIRCENEIPEHIRNKFKTRNDRKRVCNRCWRSGGTINIQCQHCPNVITLTGHQLRLNCSKQCLLKRPNYE